MNKDPHTCAKADIGATFCRKSVFLLQLSENQSIMTAYIIPVLQKQLKITFAGVKLT